MTPRAAMHWIVHIGAPKTGSTAVQRCLSDNRERLLAQGVLYPEVSLRGFGHHDLAFLLGGGYPEWATTQPLGLPALSEQLRQAVAQQRADRVILSSENFFIYPRPDRLKDLLVAAGQQPGDRTTIVCYVRRQDEAQESWYNQTVKAQGNASGFDDSLRRSHDLWDYAARLKPWQQVFGSAALMVRVYGPGVQDDICADFLGALGIDAAPLALPQGRVNDRINRDILELQRWINRLPLKTVHKRRYHKRLIALTAATAGSAIFDDRPFLAPADRTRLLAQYAEGNAWVARTFLGADNLFETPTADRRPAAPSGPPGWTVSKLALILRWLFARQPPTPPT